ncbi:MAG: hypothetical protein VYC14_09275 [Actinomycetota bacterium]|nr:hypothetical protein [Actinomycetota bacterium]
MPELQLQEGPFKFKRERETRSRERERGYVIRRPSSRCRAPVTSSQSYGNENTARGTRVRGSVKRDTGL